MPITIIDPSSALVVIDLQKGIAAMPTVHPSAQIIAHSARLVQAFRQKQRPVCFVHVYWAPDFADAVKTRNQSPGGARKMDSDFYDFVPELAVNPAKDIVIHKRNWGAFYGTDLDLQLRRRGITNIVLCGISTSIGVESTARDAWERGYQLTFATDAMTDLNADAHDRSLKIIFPRIGELGTTDELLGKL
jgi:nicotinamidase-related amidase